MTIAIDFDGTCVTHEYPHIGKSIGAEQVLQELVSNGHRLILYTMRSGKQLEEAVTWFKDKGITLYGVNRNPIQHTWTDSPKIFASLYIDDAALGIPLIKYGARPYVNWVDVKIMLQNIGVLPYNQ